MKTVLITGGTRGIGASIVHKFYSEGYRVAFFYKNSGDVARDIQERFVGTLGIKCDVSRSEDVKIALKQVIDEFGGIDILVNNAGVSHFGLLQDMTDEEWQEVIDTNLSSMFYLSRGVIPTMLKKGSGTIINVSSMWGVTGASCEVAYSASKAGVIGFTKALAKELAPSGIRVNAVAPGVVMTDMMKGFDADTLKKLSDETPLGRIGEGKDVAEAVFFLASDEASFICGEVLNVNGGFVI